MWANDRKYSSVLTREEPPTEDSDSDISEDEPTTSSAYENELVALTKFAFKECQGVQHPLSLNRLCMDFINRTGSRRKVKHLRKKLRCFSLSVHQMKTLDTETKVELLFGLSTPIHMDYLKELQRTAEVKVDKKQRIILYIADDGSLELEGNHHGSGVKKTKHVMCRHCRDVNALSITFSDSEVDFEEEQEEKFLKQYFEVDDYQNTKSLEQTGLEILQELLKGIGRDDVVTETKHRESLKTRDDEAMDFSESTNQTGKLDDIGYQSDSHLVLEESFKTAQSSSMKIKDKIREATSKKKEIEHLTVLHSFKCLLKQIDLSDFKKHEKLLDARICKATRTGEMISMNGVRLAFEQILRISTRNVFLEIEKDGEDMFSLQDFLRLLRNTAVELDMPNLEEFKQELNEVVKMIRVRDHYVMIKDLQKAFNMAIDLFSP